MTHDLPNGLPEERYAEIARSNAPQVAAAVAPPRRWRLARLVTALGAACVLALGGVAYFAQHEAHDLKRKLAQEHADNAANATAVGQLQQQVKALGGTPVASAVPTGATGPQGPAGPAPSASQIHAAVDLYCLQVTCGKPPTADQVLTAVREACAAGVDCRGPAGKNGANSQNGATGPGPTDAQIAAAVASFCATQNQCQGPVGPTGPTGATGPQGPAGTDGQPPQSWTFKVGPVTYDCVRSADFDPAAPQYTCAPEAPTTPTPTS